MDKQELKRAFVEVLLEYGTRGFAPRRKSRKKGMEFSKWLIILTGLFVGGTWLIAAASWLMWREFPAELVQYTAWYFGAAIAYLAKSGYENRAKIEKDREG